MGTIDIQTRSLHEKHRRCLGRLFHTVCWLPSWSFCCWQANEGEGSPSGYTNLIIIDQVMPNKGDKPVTEARFRCRDCGEIVEKQVRPLALLWLLHIRR